ncbi:MAG: hypothetical protein ACTJG1_10395 [Enterococcus gilvus]
MDHLKNICCFAPIMVYATLEVEGKVNTLCLELVTLAAKGWGVSELYEYALKYGSAIDGTEMVLSADSTGIVLIFRPERKKQYLEEASSIYF